MKGKYIIILAVFLLLPLWMWTAWLLTPKKKMVVAIIDKTELDENGIQHASLTWILNHEKYCKTSKKLYNVTDDYFGFYPRPKTQFRIKGLERFSSSQLDRLSNDCDVVFYADTYGVYQDEWYEQRSSIERSGIIYGGMSQQDIDFLKKAKSKSKLIISEFNSIASPTPKEIRNQFEYMFGLKWSGWTCRYFDSFDTLENKEIPHWMINNFKLKNNGRWAFKNGGLAFISNTDEVVILEDKIHLSNPIPFIETSTYGKENLNLPDNFRYPFWFDIIIPDTTVNKVAAKYNISLTEEGIDELVKHGIPVSMPAIVLHKAKDYEFYYFSGNFCLNSLSVSSSYFKAVSIFKNFLYDNHDPTERKDFFWNFYKPLVTTILNDYYHKIHSYREK